MSRQLHTADVCTLVDHDVETELAAHADGDTLLVVVDDPALDGSCVRPGDRAPSGRLELDGTSVKVYSAPLTTHISESLATAVDPAQRTLSESVDTAPADATTDGGPATQPLPEHLPNTNDKRYHFETNSRDTAIIVYAACGLYQRSRNFQDLTRVVQTGGTLVAVTAFKPNASPAHDSQWWVPTSDYARLDEIRVLEHTEFQTPCLASVFTVTATPADTANVVTTGPTPGRNCSR